MTKRNRKILGWTLSVIFSSAFIGFLIYDAGVIKTILAIGTTAVIVGAVGLCVHLTSDY